LGSFSDIFFSSFYKITCHPSFIGDLPTFRAVESNVQVSGELTTSRGPGTSFQFALSFVEQMFGPHAAEDVDRILMTQIDGDLKGVQRSMNLSGVLITILMFLFQSQMGLKRWRS